MPRKSSVRLTKTIIERVPRGKTEFDSALPGFGIRVTAKGTRSFVIQYRTASGGQGKTTIGNYPTLTVEQARELARVQLAHVKQGRNPSAERRQLRTAATFADCAGHYLGDYAKSAGLRLGTVRDAGQVLRQHALPSLGKRKVADIKVTDVRRVHGDAKAASGVYQANKLLAVMRKIFNLAIEQELRTSNPCTGVKRFPEDQRWRNFSDDEVRRILAACDLYPDQNAANAVRLLLLTGARLREVLTADWEQFDLEAGVWEKPSAHTKTKRQHRLGLDGPAYDLLQAMRGEQPAGRYLFPGRATKAAGDRDEKPRGDLKRPWAWIVKEAGLKDAKLHDIRRTTASFMLDEDVPLEVIGKTLGHTQLSTTRRYSQLRDVRQRDGLRKAGERMAGLQSPGRRANEPT